VKISNQTQTKQICWINNITNVLGPYLVLQWKLYEIIWLVLFGAIATALTIFYGSGLFTFSVYLAGIVCVILAAKGHILNYVIGLYNCFGYGYIALINGLYGEMLLNFFFFVPMALVGIMVWKGNLLKSRVKMRSLKWKQTAILSLLIGLAIWSGGLGLSLIEGQNNPYLDSATNVLSITATILMTWRFKEQWLAYITLDVITIVMWTMRALAGSPEGVLMVVMWTAYLINALYGYHVWAVGAREDSL
jgi:nicotinamide mononucleotide transporter